MSNVNIKRVVDNMRHNTTPYTPIVETIVNGIQAIDQTGRPDGKVEVRVLRSWQMQLDGSSPDIMGFEIEDNGIGFTEEHRASFDTLYTDLKMHEGGKGFGRFTALRYFDDVRVNSVFRDGDVFTSRSFLMGKDHEIIIAEEINPSNRQDTGTVVKLSPLKSGRGFEKRLTTIARNLVEKLLPYFITSGYRCPEILVSEHDGGEAIRLNDFVSNELSAAIREVKTDHASFTLQNKDVEEQFAVRLFKIYSPGNLRSRTSLVAHKREVAGSVIDRYIPEFVDEFYEKDQSGETDGSRNYIIKVYVFGSFLDSNVSLERGGFEFSMEPSLYFDIGQSQIEQRAAEIARDAMGTDIVFRQAKKRERVQAYVDAQAPWHKALLEDVDLSELPFNASHEEIEDFLLKAKSAQQIAIKRDVKNLLADTNWERSPRRVTEMVKRISSTSKDDLIHYIALRRSILELFEKSLETDESGNYSSEGLVHDIIFPRKKDSDSTPLDEHNLWIIDERLNFTAFVTSDIPLNGRQTERPDLLVYDNRVLFRGDNEESNPITIFEFKKPQRDDFVNPSSKEDPVQQIVRYVNDIRDGKFKTREGRKILVAPNTPFYGYVVCDLTTKVEKWLEREKNFTPMPDRRGWFNWMGNINLYLEVISWDKVLNDANKRSRVFFQKLGI